MQAKLKRILIPFLVLAALFSLGWSYPSISGSKNNVVFTGDGNSPIVNVWESINVLPLTIEAWVKPELRDDQDYSRPYYYPALNTVYPSNAVSGEASDHTFPYGSLGPAGHGFGLNVWDGGSELVVQDHINNFRAIPGVTFEAGQWYHIAVVYDADYSNNAGNIKTYVNGQLVDDFSFDPANYVLDGSSRARIGRHSDDTTLATKRFFKGEIVNVRLWNLALSKETVEQNMNANIHGKKPGLIYTWNSTNSKQNKE